MDTHNKYFNRAWEHLKELHPTFDLNGEALDLGVKPKVNKADYPSYITSLLTVLTIGRREDFITHHLDGRGRAVYIKIK